MLKKNIGVYFWGLNFKPQRTDRLGLRERVKKAALLEIKCYGNLLERGGSRGDKRICTGASPREKKIKTRMNKYKKFLSFEWLARCPFFSFIRGGDGGGRFRVTGITFYFSEEATKAFHC